MAGAEELETRQESGRLVAFSDGVVAIAITLLILPLADITLPKDNPEAQANPLQFVWDENSSLIVSFLVSWFVILTFWLVHHRMFGHLDRVNSSIIRWNILWLFGIIILPFPLNLLDQVGPDSELHAARQTTTFYIATMCFISLMLLLIGREIIKEPSLSKDPSKVQGRRTTRSWAVTGYLMILIPIAWFFPSVAIWLLIGLAVLHPITELVDDLLYPSDDQTADQPELNKRDQASN